MNIEELLAQIWAEKRGKVKSNVGKPTPLVVSLGNQPITAHQVVYGLLNKLLLDSDLSYEWSRTWGRTKIVVDPDVGFDFRFSIANEPNLKRGSPVFTSELISPAQLLCEDENVGLFSLELNEQKVLTEGAVLQVVRMLDELVWCRHHYLISLAGITPKHAYRLACRQVYKFGVTLRYRSEKDLLEERTKNSSLPVRMYGNVKGNNLLPLVIGNVANHRETCGNTSKIKHATTAVRNLILQRNLTFREIDYSLKINQKEVSNLATSTMPVICGITLTKSLHCGHLLLIAKSDLVRTVINSPYKLFVESNDTGARVKMMIARLAFITSLSIDSVIESLKNSEFTEELIEYAYRTRNQERISLASIPQSSPGILKLFENQAVSDMSKIGVHNLEIFSDSDLVQLDTQENMSSDGSWLSPRGFSIIRLPGRKQNRLIVIKKGGEYSASSTRALAAKYVASLCNVRSLIYVDEGSSIRDAVSVLSALNEIDVTQLPGAGFGIGLSMVSGTGGESETVSYLLNELEPETNYTEFKLLEATKYLLLTRAATVRVVASDELSTNRQILGSSFYDYHSTQAFLIDIKDSMYELVAFKEAIRNLNHQLSANESIPAQHAIKETDHKLQQLEKLYQSNLSQLFPKEACISLDSRVKLLINVMKNSGILQLDSIDFICQQYVNGTTDLTTLWKILMARGVKVTTKQRRITGDIKFELVDSLLARGYPIKDLSKKVFRYVYGDLSIVRPRCLLFEWLKSTIQARDQLNLATKEQKLLVSKGIDYCLSRLGFQ